MTKKTILKWRLGKLPTSDEVTSLVINKIINQEEAREILFSSSEEDTENLKSEIKFLRDLISKLSDRSTIVEKITYIAKPYVQYPWYHNYYVWAANQDYGKSSVYVGVDNLNVESGLNTTTLGNTSTAAGLIGSQQAQNNLLAVGSSGKIVNFSEIKTF